MQPSKSRDERVTVTGLEARGARIVKGRPVFRVLVISTVLAAVALFVAYLVLAN